MICMVQDAWFRKMQRFGSTCQHLLELETFTVCLSLFLHCYVMTYTYQNDFNEDILDDVIFVCVCF